jgi:hypothetical protein
MEDPVMTLHKPLMMTLGLMLTGASLAASAPQQNSDFRLLTQEEASALKEKLGSLEGAEREALRQAEYNRLKQRAQEAGYTVPPLAKADTAATDPVRSAPVPPVPVTPVEPPPAPAPAAPPAAPEAEPAPPAPPTPAPAPRAETEARQAAEPPATTEEKTSPATETAAETANAAAQPDAEAQPVTEPPAATYAGQYQGIRRSHEELLKSMKARRDALREQMRKRREEMARRHGSTPASEMEEQRQAEIAARQKQHEEEMLAHREEMEARRKAMEARINNAINGIGRPPAPYYFPAYRPYGAYAPYGYPERPVYPVR